MIARKSKLLHPSGVTIETPILVPSFSSRGLKLIRSKKTFDGMKFFKTASNLTPEINSTSGLVSEVTEAIRGTAEILTDSMLISAYDIFHGHIPIPYTKVLPEIFFLDSGGYEIGEYDDISLISRQIGLVNEWDITKYTEVLNSWPKHVPAVFVNYDCGMLGIKFPQQVEAAHELFSNYQDHVHDLLIKPVKKKEMTFNNTLLAIKENIEMLGKFDIIGITEKELGNSLLSRMTNIANLRIAMDDAGIKIPIHIFGSLDPITSSLYFIAGAEIFDGMTWIRYTYHEGKAVYNPNGYALTVGIHNNDGKSQAKSMLDNIYYLQELKCQMEEFLLDGDFRRFQYNGEFLEKSFQRMRTQIKRRDI